MRLMTKDIKMLAIDLDGTLLHDDMSISPFTADILKKAWTKGIRIVFATGRMFCSARAKLLPLQLGDIPVVCYTGAWTARLESQQVISQDGISPELAGEILAFARDREWKVQTFIWHSRIHWNRNTASTESGRPSTQGKTSIILRKQLPG